MAAKSWRGWRKDSVASVGALFRQEQKIYLTPTEYFTTKFREIFKNTKIKHTTGKESKAWLGGPNMKNWQEYLNFALWCATTGCGISRDILLDSGTQLSSQLRAFFQFRVYFTTKRILYEMGGIQSFSRGPKFSQTNSKYDFPSTREFAPSSK